MIIDSPYIVGSVQSKGWWSLLTLSASQSTNVAADDHIQWDTLQKSGTFDTYDDDLTTANSWATATGQDLGIIELKANKTYKLSAGLRARHTGADGAISYQFYNRTGGAYIGVRGSNNASNTNSDEGTKDGAFAIITPTVDTKVELRLFAYTSPQDIDSTYAYCFIEQIRDED